MSTLTEFKCGRVLTLRVASDTADNGPDESRTEHKLQLYHSRARTSCSGESRLTSFPNEARLTRKFVDPRYIRSLLPSRTLAVPRHIDASDTGQHHPRPGLPRPRCERSETDAVPRQSGSLNRVTRAAGDGVRRCCCSRRSAPPSSPPTARVPAPSTLAITISPSPGCSPEPHRGSRPTKPHPYGCL